MKRSDIVGAKAATREVIGGDHDRTTAENKTQDILEEEEHDGKHECILYRCILFVSTKFVYAAIILVGYLIPNFCCSEKVVIEY